MKRLLAVFALTLSCLFGKARAAAPSERETVAATLVLEAGGTGEFGMQAVCHVIFNRARAAGITPLKVVTARGQFAVMKRGASTAVAKARKHPEWRFALSVYDTFKTRRPFDFTNGSTHFESYKGKHPWWAKHMQPSVRIGGNQFYRPRKNSIPDKPRKHR